MVANIWPSTKGAHYYTHITLSVTLHLPLPHSFCPSSSSHSLRPPTLYLIRVEAKRLEAVLGLVDHTRDKEQRRVGPAGDRVVVERADNATRLPETWDDSHFWQKKI